MASAMDPATLVNIPAAKPPPGVIPNHIHPHTDAPAFIAVSTVLMAIMLTFVAVRIYTKTRIVGKYSPDDYTCVIGTIGAICYFITGLFAVTVGHFGTHMWDLTLLDLSSPGFLYSGFFTNWISAIIWPIIKMSFFLMYIQIFRPMKWLRYASYVGAAVNVLFYTSILAATLAFTAPAPGQTLEQSVQSPRQVRALSLSIPIACMSLVLDVYILILPITGVAKLQLPTQKKAWVMAVFLTGFIACIASSLSIYYKWVLIHDESDLTFETMPVILLRLVEMCVGTIASCMPSMSALLRQFPSWSLLVSRLTSHFSSTRASSKPGAKGGSSGSSDPDPMSFRKPKRTAYANLTDGLTMFGESDYEMASASVKNIRTYVHAGGPQQVEEDGIHLQYNVEQKVTVNEKGRL